MKTSIFLSLVFCLALGSLNAQWSKIDSVAQGNINSINFINADTGFVYHQPGIIRRTANGGQSWDTINLNFTANIHDMDFASANVGYAVGGAWFPHGRHYPYAIFKTTDGGLSWDSIFSGSNGGMFTHVATLSETEFFATGIEGMLHSDDGGMSFDTVSVSNLPFGTEQYSRVRFLNANKGYVLGRSNSFTGHLQNLYETNDGGQNWNSIHADSVYNFSVDFVMNAAGNGLIIGNDSHVLRTTNGGASWQTIPLPMTFPGLSLNQIEEADGHIYAKGSNGLDTSSGIYHSPDWGNTWQKLFSRKTNAGGAIMDMSIPSSGVGYCALWRSVYKNDNLISLPEPISKGFGFYPNPTTGIVSIELPGEGLAQINVYNSLGQKVMELTSDGNPVFNLDVGSLHPGIYFLKIQMGGESLVKKLVKE